MNMLTRYIFFCLTLCKLLLPLNSLGANPPVTYLGIEQGLSNNAVTCILQDNYGFMWMGTYNGLNRYDSSRFIIYNNVWDDPGSLISSHINHLSQDRANRIWVGTQKGVNWFSYSNSRFSPVWYLRKGKKIKITSNINGLASDKKGQTFIATDDLGLLLYSDADKVAHRLRLAAQLPEQKAEGNHKTAEDNYNVQALILDQQDKLWLFIKDIGLCSYNPVQKQIVIEDRSLKTAYCLMDDHRKNIWIGTEAGLYQYNIPSRKVSALSSGAYKLSSNNIKHLYLDRSARLWISTDGGGINILDLKSGRLSYLAAGEAQGFLKSGSISDVYQDKASRIWIATLRGGVNIIDPEMQGFELIRHDPLHKNSLVNNFVLSFCEDSQNNLWIGTDGGGLSILDSKKKTYRNFVADKAKPGSISSNFVVSILEDHQQRIWIATFSGGIDLYQKATGRFKHYTCYNTAKQTEENNLWKLFEDSSHRLWAGTTRDGALYLYNPLKDRFELFDKNLTNIHTLFEDKQGVLWAGNYTSLIRIDLRHKKHRFIRINSAVRAMLEDIHGNFWIGTEGGGLLLFNRSNNTFRRYTDVDGLADNSVLNLLQDNKGKIWLSSFNGISVFDPLQHTFKNYVAADALQSNQFNYNAALKLRSGELLFGGIKGFSRFDPERINMQHRNAVLRVTGFKVNNVPLADRKEYLEEGSLVNLKKLTIPYEQATLAFDYVALEYSFPEKISYAYFLEGWDRSWNYVGKTKTAYYSRLNPGTYQLRIKATDINGNWLPPQTIRITILSPWYLSCWALSIYVLIIVTIFYLIRMNRIRQIRLRYEVALANTNVEKEKELNEKKLSFFTNISHEFRTPLTLIINPIKDLLMAADQTGKSELNAVYRNARRLLGLVDQLLLFRRTETEEDRLNIVRNDFLTVCNEVFACFIQQAKVKKISYNFSCEAAHIELYGDREKMEITLFNLISNAFNLTPEGGKIDVLVTEDEQAVYFRIADNGQGVPEEMTARIFDKFYQGRNYASLNNGFGIGLYLAKTFVEQHGGEISCVDTEGGGMTFIVKFRKGKAHFNMQHLSDSQAVLQKYVTEILSDQIPELPVQDESVAHLELMISNKQTILMIDGNQEIRAYIKKIFLSNYTIIEAKDGEEGLMLVRKNLPDIIISEVIMTGISGIELCHMIKQDTSLSHIPVILLTADYTPELKLLGIEAGAVDFISKPFEKDLLIARVNGILKIKAELQHYFYSEITLKTDTRTISEVHKDFLYQCIAIIESSLLDTDFDVQRISSEMGMSYSSLLKKIRAVTGHSVSGFIRFIRLRKAAELMIHTNCNVNEAALQVGINDIKYFRAQFHKLFEINPSDFIKKHRKAFQKSYHFNKRQLL
jgi:signal transduction histidine kinase/ligand-binding sensor domain-containing protein/CheY-like chemotaxis protein/AraC-like DNA-binding protein